MTSTPKITSGQHFQIPLISRKYKGGKEVKVRANIGDVRHLEFSSPEHASSLTELFKIANKHTLNVEYPCEADPKWAKAKGIHRPNHNGTHSARQAKVMVELLKVLKILEPDKYKLYSEEEKLQLVIAAYFLRSGRVDESSHNGGKPDNYYTRSAQIYTAYAEQLQNCSSQVREWIKFHIEISTILAEYRSSRPTTTHKDFLTWNLITICHELDLIRCFGKTLLTKKTFPSLLTHLYNVFPKHNAIKLRNEFIKLNTSLLKINGVKSNGGHYSQGNADIFEKCSKEGDYCWQKLLKAQLNYQLLH